MNNLFIAREHGKLDNGVSYVMLQDGPRNFHVTVNYNNLYQYDYFTPLNIQELRDSINKLGQEIFEAYHLTTTQTSSILSTVHQSNEQTNTED